MRDEKPVPEPGEAGRDGDEIHYHDVDESNVYETKRPIKPPADPPHGNESSGAERADSA